MQSGKCPKCGSETIYKQRNGIELGHYRGVIIYTGRVIHKPSPLDSYLCTTCGYFENYIVDLHKLARVTETWQKVVPYSQRRNQG